MMKKYANSIDQVHRNVQQGNSKINDQQFFFLFRIARAMYTELMADNLGLKLDDRHIDDAATLIAQDAEKSINADPTFNDSDTGTVGWTVVDSFCEAVGIAARRQVSSFSD